MPPAVQNLWNHNFKQSVDAIQLFSRVHTESANRLQAVSATTIACWLAVLWRVAFGRQVIVKQKRRILSDILPWYLCQVLQIRRPILLPSLLQLFPFPNPHLMLATSLGLLTPTPTNPCRLPTGQSARLGLLVIPASCNSTCIGLWPAICKRVGYCTIWSRWDDMSFRKKCYIIRHEFRVSRLTCN